jgi:peptide/nickel transport system ATP-binding protein
MTLPGETPLLEVRSLRKEFVTTTRDGWRRRTQVFRALDDVSFDVHKGENLAVIGESGSGKTTCARCILRALDPTAGSVIFHGGGGSVDVAKLPESQLKPIRRQMQMIFQDPFASLNPRMRVGEIVAEPLVIHREEASRGRRERVMAMLERVRLNTAYVNRYPHALSGGQRQRVGIARALILRPAFVVADEAVSALDVSVQAQVLDLLKELQRELGLTYLFVTHNLAVVKQICDRVAVMYKGRIVEMGKTQQVLSRPRHAYTRVLISAVPSLDPDRRLAPLSVADVPREELEKTFV